MSQRPETLIRRLGRRYAAVLAVVALVLLVDQALLQPMMVRLNLAAPVINLAGRQRMLSQRIVKDALTIALKPEAVDQLAPVLTKNVEDWKRVHAALESGSSELQIPKPSDSAVTRDLLAMDSHVASMSAAVSRIAAHPTDAANEIELLLSNERVFLPAMDAIVQQYEQDARQQVASLRTTALAGMALVLVLMSGLYWLVLRPGVDLIRDQVDRLEAHELELMQSQQLLEQRVEDRTRELSLTNQALAAAAVERVQAEERTLQLQNQLAHSARLNSLGELATGIAHEINQPLGAIANYSETLLVLNERETADRIAIAATTQKIREAAQRAGQIIRRMRNFVRSRPQSRSLERINPLIEDVVALCEPDLRSHCVRVATDDYRTTDIALTIDAIGLQQVLVNIVRNAVDAMREMPADERRLLITTAAGDDDFVTITVDDTGPGFRHTPAESTVPFMTTKADGLGLGLAISRSIVEAHSGRLSLGSSPEGGARVIVSLPLPLTARTREPADGLCC